MGLREPEGREPDELRPDELRGLGAHPLRGGTREKAAAVGKERFLTPLPAHRPAKPLGLPDAEAGECDRDVEHLVLEDDHPECLPERLGQEWMVVGRLVARIFPPALAALDVGMDGLPLDRPGPDERNLDGEIVEVLGARPEEALHLRAALDLEEPDRVGLLDLPVDVRVVQWDPGEVDGLAAKRDDLLDALLDGGEHAQTEEVDLEEAGIGTGVLVPLADLAPLHGCRLDGNELDERPGRDDHASRVLGEMARQPGDLAAELAKGPPAWRFELRLGIRE